jgi:hypothetical protein
VLRPNGYVVPDVDWEGDEEVVTPHVNEDVQNWLATQNSGWCNNTYGKYINICGNVTYCTSAPPLGNYYDGFSIDIGFYWDGTDTGLLICAGGDDMAQHRFNITLNATTGLITSEQRNARILSSSIQAGKHLVSYYNSINGVLLYVDGLLVDSSTSTEYLSLVTTNEAGFVLGARMSELGGQDQWLKFVPFFFHLRNTTSSWNFNVSITQQTSTIILLNNQTVSGNMWNSTVGSLNAYAAGTTSWITNYISICQ